MVLMDQTLNLRPDRVHQTYPKMHLLLEMAAGLVAMMGGTTLMRDPHTTAWESIFTSSCQTGVLGSGRLWLISQT